MGSTKVASTQQATPTPEETQLNQRDLRIALGTEGQQLDVQKSGLSLVNQLLQGQSALPGFFSQLAGGISSETIGTQAAQMGKAAMPGFQSLGVLDSGEAQKSISKQIANELLFPAQQFNIGSLQNLLNLAMGGQAQVQQPIQANVNNLNQSLAGLRTTTSNQTTGYDFFTSPFTSSFLQAAGTAGGGYLSRSK